MNRSKPLSKNASPNPRPEAQGFLTLNQSLLELYTFIDFSDQFTLGFLELNFAPAFPTIFQAL
jgi:hypothetical protein